MNRDIPHDKRLEMTEHKSPRGFQLVEFRDYYNEPSSLQQSSLAIYEQPGTGAVWLGRNNHRMHLNEQQVKELVNRLSHWLETGNIFHGSEDENESR